MYNGKSYSLSKNAKSVSYSDNTRVGWGRVTFTGTGDFTGTDFIEFTIIPKKVTGVMVAAGKKRITVRWKKASAAQSVDEYHIRYRVKGTTTWKIKKVPASKSSKVIKGLKKGKKYQVQVCAYHDHFRTDCFGLWSAMKTTRKKVFA